MCCSRRWPSAGTSALHWSKPGRKENTRSLAAGCVEKRLCDRRLDNSDSRRDVLAFTLLGAECLSASRTERKFRGSASAYSSDFLAYAFSATLAEAPARQPYQSLDEGEEEELPLDRSVVEH